ncbi:unnamed protein product [Pleuronectes platessa]|uniref:Uncharacterized protein n=1 Tax=Pleuronectes platessa TaxID=8262 RepID=A0A9N7VI57_PLEPL|nr:unnamed protein product [Pleuronectes platessa]
MIDSLTLWRRFLRADSGGGGGGVETDGGRRHPAHSRAPSSSSSSLTHRHTPSHISTTIREDAADTNVRDNRPPGLIRGTHRVFQGGGWAALPDSRPPVSSSLHEPRGLTGMAAAADPTCCATSLAEQQLPLQCHFSNSEKREFVEFVYELRVYSYQATGLNNWPCCLRQRDIVHAFMLAFHWDARASRESSVCGTQGLTDELHRWNYQFPRYLLPLDESPWECGRTRLGLALMIAKTPPPALFSQSWRGRRADVSEGERVFVFWSPEETSHITLNDESVSVSSVIERRVDVSIITICSSVRGCQLPSITHPSSSSSIFLNLDQREVLK